MIMKTILLVDDDMNIRNALKRVLRHPEINFVDASNGMSALDKIINNEIDIILLDYKMPHVDGIELLNWIYKVYPKIKIIILSGFIEKKLLERLILFNEQVIRILAKPCDENTLRSIVLNDLALV